MSVKYWCCEITRCVADEPQPGIVEARAQDAHGQEWGFVDKSAIFSAETLTPATEYPVEGIIGCEVVVEGSEISRVTTVWTNGFRPEDGPFDALRPGGESEFDVLAADLTDPYGIPGAAK